MTTLSCRDLAIGAGRRTLVEHLNIEFEPGAVTAVLGPNGAGKTTLLRTLAGAISAQSGEVLLNGTSVKNLDAMQRARLLAVVPQASPPPTAMSVLDYARLSRLPWGGASDEDRVVDALIETDVARLAQRACDRLSGGEWRRTQLARALAQDTPVLLLDEPFEALDPKHRQVLSRLLAKTAGTGHSIILTLHEPTLTKGLASQALLLFENEAALHGPTDVLLTNANLSRLYDLD